MPDKPTDTTHPPFASVPGSALWWGNIARKSLALCKEMSAELLKLCPDPIHKQQVEQLTALIKECEEAQNASDKRRRASEDR